MTISRLRALAFGLGTFFAAGAADLVLVAPSHAQTDVLTGVASVVDGDTIEIHGTRIRLHGIDAPESAQECVSRDERVWRCGQQAALALADRIGRNPVSCRRTDTDRYGRMIGICSQGATDLNAWMVESGWAVAYSRYSRDYVEHEARARSAGRNIWSGRFVMPWDWRRGARVTRTGTETGSAGARDPSCLIKGNINSAGERIYHLPGGQFYDRTQIDASAGERWFCSEAEARAAGWRRSGR